jgi:hypothetical protein
VVKDGAKGAAAKRPRKAWSLTTTGPRKIIPSCGFEEDLAPSGPQDEASHGVAKSSHPADGAATSGPRESRLVRPPPRAERSAASTTP